MTLHTTKNGLFQYTEECGGSDEIIFRELSAAEVELVMARVTEVHHFLDRYLPEQSELGISPRVLDQLFIKWLADESYDKPDEESVAAVLGATFAYHLQNRKHMIWGGAQARGEEPTLAVTNRELGLTIYPISSVQKRINSGSAGFFEPIFAVVQEKLNELHH